MTVKEGIKSLFNFGGTQKSTILSTSPILSAETYRGGEQWIFQDIPGQTFTYRGHASASIAYDRCPPVAAIINRQAQAYINGKTWVMNSKGKESQEADAKKLRKLLAKPNPLQSWKDFEAEGYIYRRKYGWNLILPIKPIGFKRNIDATSLWNVPPHMVDIKENGKLFYQSTIADMIESVTLTYGNTKTVLNKEDIFIIKDFVPSANSKIIPDSRLKALELPINNIIAAYESRGVLIKSRGPMYVVSSAERDGSGVTPMKPAAKDQLQADFKRSYGITKEQSMAIITNKAVTVQTVGFSTADLQLLEENRDSTLAICDNLNYPPHLLGVIDPTFNNRISAEKDLYQNSIIPDAESIYEQWQNFFFGTEDMNIFLQKDFSHLAVLQDDELAKANARLSRNRACEIEWKNGLITMNRWLELNGEDTRPDANIYYEEYIKINPGARPIPAGAGQETQVDGEDQSGKAKQSGK